MTEALRFSSSEEVAFKTCPLAHHFAYGLRYAPSYTNERLDLGITFHEALEVYYRGGDQDAIEARLQERADERWAQIIAVGLLKDESVREDFQKAKALVRDMAFRYIEWVREDGLDDDYETVEVEGKGTLQVPGAPCVMPWKLDLLQRRTDTGLLRIVDFKTRDSFSSNLTAYDLSEQNGNYALAVFAKYGEKPTEMAYREARKMSPTLNPRSKPPYFREVLIRLTPEAMAKRARDYAATAIERFREDRPIVANPSACCGSWKGDWRKPCLKVAEGMSPLEALETTMGYAPKDPYERYEEGHTTPGE